MLTCEFPSFKSVYPVLPVDCEEIDFKQLKNLDLTEVVYIPIIYLQDGQVVNKYVLFRRFYYNSRNPQFVKTSINNFMQFFKLKSLLSFNKQFIQYYKDNYYLTVVSNLQQFIGILETREDDNYYYNSCFIDDNKKWDKQMKQFYDTVKALLLLDVLI